MQTHNIEQGSAEWHAHRRAHFNASDAPAMLGVSPYKTRSQLLDELATGISQEFDAATERRFADGHRFEAMARPLAEKIIGEELSPVVGSEGKYAASFDGITMLEDVIFEHKTFRDDIALALGDNGNTGALAEHYRIQMEHQLMVSGASKCLFMATKWNGDALAQSCHGWYIADHALRNRILAGWEQFEKDLAEHRYVEITEKPKAEAILDLPALSVQATGMVTYSNLPEFKAAAQAYIANINTDLQTDNDFANAEATVKFCKSTEEKLEVTKSAILAQTSTIDEVIRTVDHIQAQLREKRLQLDKLVKSEKESRKIEMVRNASDRYTAHVTGLQSEIGGVQFLPLLPRQDFGAAIKGLKSLASMHDALDTAVANAKISADATAKDVRDKLAWCKDSAAGMSFLFPDLQQIITKPLDDFKLTITSRIEKHKADESAKVEAERQRIEAAAKAKAEREAAEKMAAEEARIRAEERAKAQAEAVALANREQLAAKERAESAKNNHQSETVMHDGARPALVQTEPAAPVASQSRPTDDQIIAALALHYRVHESKVIEWLLDMDLDAACERMAGEFAA